MRRTASLRSWVWLVIFSMCVLDSPAGFNAARAADLQASLEAIRQVGSEGSELREASAAWKSVSQSKLSDLTTILAGIDGANPVAANWIRSAVDTIAQRETAAGEKLPEPDLEKFILDTSHAPRARRMAFELLQSANQKLANRLIPKFLKDPSVELRRDAVALAMQEGALLVSEGNMQEEAKQAYLLALSGAVELDQVNAIVEELKKLGQEVDLQKHFGFLAGWQLIGPFNNVGEKGFDLVYGPEEGPVNLSSSHQGMENVQLKWQAHDTKDNLGMVDLNTALGKANGVLAYAYAEFESDREQEAEIRIGSTNAVKVFVNGDSVGEFGTYHSGFSMDQYVSRIRLVPGKNVILLKVCQNEQTEEWAQDWHFQARVCDLSGEAILSTATPATSK